MEATTVIGIVTDTFSKAFVPRLSRVVPVIATGTKVKVEVTVGFMQAGWRIVIWAYDPYEKCNQIKYVQTYGGPGSLEKHYNEILKHLSNVQVKDTCER